MQTVSRQYGPRMAVLEAVPTAHALYTGLFGGSCVVLVQLAQASESHQWPWREGGFRKYVIASAARLVLGAGMAIMMAKSGQISGLGGAFVIGISAPVVVSRIVASTSIARTATAEMSSEVGAQQVTSGASTSAQGTVDGPGILTPPNGGA